MVECMNASELEKVREDAQREAEEIFRQLGIKLVDSEPLTGMKIPEIGGSEDDRMQPTPSIVFSDRTFVEGESNAELARHPQGDQRIGMHP